MGGSQSTPTIGIEDVTFNETTGDLSIIMTDESVKGPFKIKGAAGDSILTGVYDDKTGELLIETSSGKKLGPFKVAGKVGPMGPAGKDGAAGKDGPAGPAGKDADTSKTLWCADGKLCAAPTGAKTLQWGSHHIKFDEDNVVRHLNKDNTHKGMGLATGNLWVTDGCLHIKNHSICSEGPHLKIKSGPNSKEVSIYQDSEHSSVKVERKSGATFWYT
jgi:hypothetical protein